MTLKKINIIFLVFCGVVTLGVGGMLVFNLQEVLSSDKVIMNQRAQARSFRRRLKEKQEFIDRFLKEKKEFEQYLFSEKDVPAFLDGISAFAQQTSINVLDMQAEQFREVAVKTPAVIKAEGGGQVKSKGRKQDSADELTLAAMPIRFRVKGNFSNLLQFLGQLEGFKQLLSIGDIEIRKQNEYPLLECAFKLQIYSFKTQRDL